MPMGSARAFAFLDTQEQLERCSVELAPNLRRVVFLLEGIHCAGCVWILEKLNRANPAIRSSRLDFATGELEVQFDPGATEISQIAWLLQRLGYRGVPLPVERERASRRAVDRQSLTQLAVAGFCAANTMMLAVALIQGIFTGIETEIASYFRWFSLLIATPAVFYSAQPFYRASWGALRNGHFHLDLPLSLAIIAGYLVSAWNTIVGEEYVYFDSVTALIFFLLIGRVIQRGATQRALRDSRNAWDLLPMMVERRMEGGGVESVPTSALRPGDTIVVRAGDRIAVDGVITAHRSAVDASILTGESTPVEVAPGAAVQAGTLNISSEIEVRVEVTGTQTRIGRLLDEVRRRGRNRAPILEFTNQISGYFIAGVLALAVGTFFLWRSHGVGVALENALALLIVTCPCALGIATPVAMSVAMGRAARAGLLIKGEEVIERLAKTEVIFLDKTGTVTEGVLEIVEVHELAPPAADLRALIRELASRAAPHPVVRALNEWSDREQHTTSVSPLAVENTLGRGIAATSADGTSYHLGSSRWFSELGIPLNAAAMFETELGSRGLSVAMLAENRTPVAVFGLLDTPRTEAAAALAMLRDRKIELHLLSGDLPPIVAAIGAQLGIPPERCHGGQFPEHKEQTVLQEPRFKAVIGDGVNDTAAMTVADVALGLRGEAEVLTEVADVVITRGAVESVALAFVGAARTMAIVRRNLIISLIYNCVGAVLAIAGMVNPLVAALIMPVSSLTVIVFAACSKTFEPLKRPRTA